MSSSGRDGTSLNSPGDPAPFVASGKGKWMALLAALLGWMFDGLEMGLFPLVARPALKDLLQTTDDGQVGLWLGIMTAAFLVGAATGGVVFGWLGDRVGRVRAMTLSVLTYTVFTGLCGVAGSAEQVFLFRFIAALGMGGEWSLGVSLVMEIWPNRSRAWLAGLIGAAANVGFLTIAVVSIGLTEIIGSLEQLLRATPLPDEWVTALVANSGWRLLMMFGAAPALLTFFIRLFVPESERWLHEHDSGSTSNWAVKDLAGVVIGGLGPFLIVYLWAFDHPFGLENPFAVRLIGSAFGLALAFFGYVFPVHRYLERAAAGTGVQMSLTTRQILGRMLIGACLSGTALIGTWGSVQWAPSWADQLAQKDHAKQAELAASTEISVEEANKPSGKIDAKAYTQIVTGIGAIIGTILAAFMGNWFGRRISYTMLCLGSLASAQWFFRTNDQFDGMFLVGAFLVGAVTASFYGWLPLYLPELFPTRVRATGQGFAFNFGRILAAIAALQTGYLMKEIFNGSYSAACSVISFVYLVGVVIIWFAPETNGQELPE